jgi:A/G-specific adenine glycosylase
MLQQTRVDTVVPYFERFVRRFPDAASLAAADLGEVLKAWEGLGYYARARNLHEAARRVVDRWAGALPPGVDALRELPGFGPYTAAAVASIAFGAPAVVVDGNVLRVFARFFGIADDIRKPSTREEIAARLAGGIEGRDPAAFNQAIMELGALVCHRREPGCDRCPLALGCVAHHDNRTAELPYRSPSRRVPHHAVAVGVIWREGRILIGRRRVDQMLGGLWEFPGGKQRAGESPERAAAREIREETGLRVRVGEVYATVEHTYSHFRITLTAYRCEAGRGVPRPHVNDELRWVALEELDRYPFPRASLKVIEAVRRAEGMRGDEAGAAGPS